MKIKAEQMRLYWATWRGVRAILIKQGFSPAAADEVRHEIHIEALKKDISSKDMSNAELNKVLDVMTLKSPGTRDREGLIVGLQKLNADAYLNAIARDKWDAGNWRECTTEQLRQLRMTAARRFDRKKTKATAG